MKIVILGAGETGSYLGQMLLNEGHDLVFVENDEKVVRLVQERFDAQVVQGDGASALVLEPLIDEKTDLFLALTNSDNANIIATLIARRFGAKRVITRASDPTNLIHPLLTEDPKVSVLNAEMAVAKDLSRLIGNPSADEVELFANGKAEMVKFHVGDDASVANRALKSVKIPKAWLFIGMTRNGQFSILSGDSVLLPGDQVLLMGDPKWSKELEELLGLRSLKVKRVIIIGFNDLSSKLASTFKRNGIDVRLIEENKEQAVKASEELDGVLVLHGDGTSEEILDQAGIDQTDYLLALTHDDETNVLISLLAKEKKVDRVIALAQKPQYKPIIEKIGIHSVINPRSAIGDEIIRLIHHKDISAISILGEGQGKMMEFILKENSKLTGIPLFNLKLPKETLVGAIVRGSEVIIPRGNDRLETGDHIVVFTNQSSMTQVNKLFAQGK